jgi:Domain of unknown function (DUF4440)
MRSAICIFILSAAALAQNAAQPAPPDPSLIAAEKSFVAAAKKGDAAFFKQTLAPDFSFVSFDGEIGDRQDMIDFMSSGGIDLLPYDMKVVPVADGVAIVTYDVVFRVPPSQDEGPPPRYQHFSTVWVKQGDAWKMKFQQMTASHFGDW